MCKPDFSRCVLMRVVHGVYNQFCGPLVHLPLDEFEEFPHFTCSLPFQERRCLSFLGKTCSCNQLIFKGHKIRLWVLG